MKTRMTVLNVLITMLMNDDGKKIDSCYPVDDYDDDVDDLEDYDDLVILMIENVKTIGR